MKHSIGKILCDCSDNSKLLNSLLDCCHANKLSVINNTFHNFTPQGYTALILLGESHMSLHSFPESNLVMVDLFSCNIVNDTEAILKDLSKRLSGTLEDLQTFDRNLDNYSWRQ